MAKSGRKSKPGKRKADGRLSQAGLARRDKGSGWVAVMQARYGSYYSSAIGRAFASGLLDDPANDKTGRDRFDNATRFASIYKRVFGGDAYRCPLDDSPRGGKDVVAEISERDIASREWLRVNTVRIDHTACRPFMDQLISSAHVDVGPEWLERLLAAKPSERDPRDRMILDCALKAIDAMGAVNVARAEPLVLAA